MSEPKKRWKVFQEEAKTRQTSHWDLDYMSTEELDALMQESRRRDEGQAEAAGRTRRRRKVLIAAVLVVLVAAGALLFGWLR